MENENVFNCEKWFITQGAKLIKTITQKEEWERDGLGDEFDKSMEILNDDGTPFKTSVYNLDNGSYSFNLYLHGDEELEICIFDDETQEEAGLCYAGNMPSSESFATELLEHLSN